MAISLTCARSRLRAASQGVSKEESEEARYRNVRNLADAIVIFENQYARDPTPTPMGLPTGCGDS